MQYRLAPDFPTCCMRRVACALLVVLAGCGTVRPPPAPDAQGRPTAGTGSKAPALPAAGSGRGGYYLDDGPGDAPPDDLLATPDAEPKIEPYSLRSNRPYAVFGKTYTPMTDDTPLKQRGIGSWYGKKFHGQKTSSGELYDMYKMTAAHPTLPIPSYVRVTNLKNGKQVVVRVNDRGPFHSSRIIDVSYTAALKLGYLGYGSSELEVERILPEEINRMKIARESGVPAAVVLAPVAVLAAVPVSTPFISATSVQSLDDFLKTQEAQEARDTPPVALVALSSAQPLPLALPPATVPGGFYLQFGAYAQSANAEAMRDRLMQRWPPSVPSPQVQRSGTVFRLYSGPFDNRSEAQQAAALSANPVAIPLVVQR